jgi:hypothetical protein
MGTREGAGHDSAPSPLNRISAAAGGLYSVVREGGLEPPRSFLHTALNRLARVRTVPRRCAPFA